MIIVRALTVLAKPAILSGAIAATAVGGWFAVDSLRPHDAPSAFQRIQGQGQRLLVSEFGDRGDTIVALDPSDAGGSRTTIATIDHAPGYGIFATLSPDGKAIAYTALPSDTAKSGPASPARAAIVSVKGDVTPLGFLHFHQPSGKNLKFAAVFLKFILRSSTLADVANIALHDAGTVDLIHIADELDVDDSSIAGLEREILQPDTGLTFQFEKCRLERGDLLERGGFPQLIPDQYFASIAKHLRQRRIDVFNLTGVCGQNQDSVLCGFK